LPREITGKGDSATKLGFGGSRFFGRFFGDRCLILVLTVVPVLVPPRTAPVLPPPVSVGWFGMGWPVGEALGTPLETIPNATNAV
jgi:hypothetical protein